MLAGGATFKPLPLIEVDPMVGRQLRSFVIEPLASPVPAPESAREDMPTEAPGAGKRPCS